MRFGNGSDLARWPRSLACSGGGLAATASRERGGEAGEVAYPFFAGRKWRRKWFVCRTNGGLSAEWEGRSALQKKRRRRNALSLSLLAPIQLQLNSVMPTFEMPCTDNHCSFCGAVVSYLRIVPVTIPLISSYSLVPQLLQLIFRSENHPFSLGRRPHLAATWMLCSSNKEEYLESCLPLFCNKETPFLRAMFAGSKHNSAPMN